MNRQQTLFRDRYGLVGEESGKLARRSDPASSHAAAREMVESGKIRGQKLAVLAALVTHGGRTSFELTEFSGLDRYAAARRLPDLEKLGLAKKGPIRECRVCKRPCVTWFATAAGQAALGRS